MNSLKLLKSTFVLFVLLTCAISTNAQSNSKDEDQQGVYAAVEDYVLGLYEVAPDRIARSVDKSLYKIGYYDYKGEAQYNVPMTYDQLHELSGSWNKNGDRASDTSPRKIEIYQVHDKTASAMLTAEWGIDFMHLAKNKDGKWMIMSIMWQSEPK